MNRKKLLAPVLVVVGIAALAVLTVAHAKEDKPTGLPADFKLPKGWTMEDMQACVLAGTPGEMHKLLAKDIGECRASITRRFGAHER